MVPRNIANIRIVNPKNKKLRVDGYIFANTKMKHITKDKLNMPIISSEKAEVINTNTNNKPNSLIKLFFLIFILAILFKISLRLI